MITSGDFYNVMSAVVPLYVAMILAYGSVRWWKILTPDQCSGINRFVAIFAVPLLSFQIISRQNPYDFNRKFVIADALQKFVVLAVLAIWAKFSSKGSLDWVITLFMLATLPNTLVVGIPLLTAMYGEKPASIVIQAVVLQSIVWYTLLLFLYEYRSARILILQKFPKEEPTSTVITVKVDPAIIIPEKMEVKTEASDGKLYVHLVKTPTSSMNQDMHSASSFKTTDISSSCSSKVSTPCASDLSNAEVYSVSSSAAATPSNSLNRQDFFLMAGCGTPVEPHFFDQTLVRVPPFFFDPRATTRHYRSRPNFEEQFRHLVSNHNFAQQATQITKQDIDETGSSQVDYDAKELQMFVWSASTSPATSPMAGLSKWHEEKFHEDTTPQIPEQQQPVMTMQNIHEEDNDPGALSKRLSNQDKDKDPPMELLPESQMPSTAVMLKMILSLVWKKLVRNPNTYSSLFGLAWALIKFRWNVQLPTIIDGSIKILSNTGLGMAMFSLGLFMALQSRLLACGTYMTVFGMVVRFVTGPAIMSAASFAVGLHGLELRASILQAALSQGIVPFVFAKEYNVHPDILSTAVIFGMLVSLPIVLVYYVLLGL